MTKKSKGLSIQAYADHRKAEGLPGGSPSAVSKALASGRISRNEHNRIDPVQADADWLKNTATNRQAQARSGKAPDGSTGPTSAADYNLHKARKMKADADSAELDLEVKKGRLLDRERVYRDGYSTGQAVCDRLLAMIPRLAPEFASMEDPREIEELWGDELHEVLTRLTEKK